MLDITLVMSSFYIQSIIWMDCKLYIKDGNSMNIIGQGLCKHFFNAYRAATHETTKKTKNHSIQSMVQDKIRFVRSLLWLILSHKPFVFLLKHHQLHICNSSTYQAHGISLQTRGAVNFWTSRLSVFTAHLSKSPRFCPCCPALYSRCFVRPGRRGGRLVGRRRRPPEPGRTRGRAGRWDGKTGSERLSGGG